MRTSKLTGEALHWATAKADGLEPTILPSEYGTGPRVVVGDKHYRPTVDWLQAGELLERHGVAVGQLPTKAGVWCADFPADAGKKVHFATKPRTAICRAVVAAAFGETVEIPEELS
jgi:hypothetical protein